MPEIHVGTGTDAITVSGTNFGEYEPLVIAESGLLEDGSQWGITTFTVVAAHDGTFSFDRPLEMTGGTYYYGAATLSSRGNWRFVAGTELSV